jgi:hypothetical protein
MHTYNRAVLVPSRWSRRWKNARSINGVHAPGS